MREPCRVGCTNSCTFLLSSNRKTLLEYQRSPLATKQTLASLAGPHCFLCVSTVCGSKKDNKHGCTHKPFWDCSVGGVLFCKECWVANISLIQFEVLKGVKDAGVFHNHKLHNAILLDAEDAFPRIFHGAMKNMTLKPVKKCIFAIGIHIVNISMPVCLLLQNHIKPSPHKT